MTKSPASESAKAIKWMLDERGDRAMSAYYYGFDRTGVEAVDRILAEVAWAGKAYHLTEQWDTVDEESSLSVIDRMQAAASEAATEIQAAEQQAREDEAELRDIMAEEITALRRDLEAGDCQATRAAYRAAAEWCREQKKEVDARADGCASRGLVVEGIRERRNALVYEFAAAHFEEMAK